MTIAVRRLQRWLLLIIGLIAIGCSSDDQRLIEVSRQSLDRQAEQNRLVTTNNQQVIDATGKLVEADAQARRENIQLQHEIQSERSGINQQRDHLEQERRQIAEQRGRDPIIAESIQSAVGLIVAALPLVVCLFVLRGLFHKSDDEAMADVLVEELVSYQPLFADPEGMRLPTDAGSRLLAPSLELGTSGVPLLREAPATQSSDLGTSQVVVVVEGLHDIEFLRRISRMLHKHDPDLPDLDRLEADGRLTFLTARSNGLGSVSTLGSLTCGEFHLYDREMPPVTDERLRLVGLLKQRPRCRAAVTTKRAIENYLHPDAVCEAGRIEASFGYFDDVAEIVARAEFQVNQNRSWEALSRRARRRLRDKAKRWLNREAVDRMTPARLAERDPDGEVIGWLQTIAELANVQGEAPAPA